MNPNRSSIYDLYKEKLNSDGQQFHYYQQTNTTSHLNSLNINNYHDIWQWKSGGGVTPVNEQTNDHKPAHQVAGLHQSMNRQTITNLHIRWRNYTSQWTNKRSQTCTSGGGITPVNEQTNDHKPAQIHGHSNDHILSQKWMII
jgi:hypothetical protein